MNFNGDGKIYSKRRSIKEKNFKMEPEVEEEDKSSEMLHCDLINSINIIITEIIEESQLKEKNKKEKTAHNSSDSLTTDELSKEDPTLLFLSRKPPKISIINYLERILRYSKIEESTLIIMLIYIDRLCDFNDLILNKYNIHRIMMTSVLIAIKYNEDDYYSNKYYAKVGGIPLTEINTLEIEFMKLVKYSLFVNESLFNTYNNYLKNLK